MYVLVYHPICMGNYSFDWYSWYFYKIDFSTKVLNVIWWHLKMGIFFMWWRFILVESIWANRFRVKFCCWYYKFRRDKQRNINCSMRIWWKSQNLFPIFPANKQKLTSFFLNRFIYFPSWKKDDRGFTMLWLWVGQCPLQIQITTKDLPTATHIHSQLNQLNPINHQITVSPSSTPTRTAKIPCPSFHPQPVGENI